MKVAHISDPHITSKMGKASMSLKEQIEVLSWIADDVKRQGCKLALVSGDIFDSNITTPEEREAASVFLYCLPGTVVIPGNHDHKKDVELVASAARKMCLSIPGTHSVGGCTIHFLPYPSRSNLAAWMPETAKIDETMTAGLRMILQGFSAVQTDLPRILVAHLDVHGAQWDGGQEAVGQPVSVTPDDLKAVGADYVALGHYHRRQEVAPGIWYGGATRQMRFGDDARKGYVIWDSETGEVTERDAPGRQLIDAKWFANESFSGFNYDRPIQPEGNCVYRVRYEVDEQEREAKRREVEEKAKEIFGDSKIIYEPKVIAKAVARVPGMQKAKTITEKINALWEAEGRPARASEIIDKAEQLTQPVQ